MINNGENKLPKKRLQTEKKLLINRHKKKRVCLIAGDIFPVDVISHLPVLCEEAGIPYIYVPTKEALGIASATKRPTSCVLIGANKDSEYKPLYDKCTEFIKETQQ